MEKCFPFSILLAPSSLLPALHFLVRNMIEFIYCVSQIPMLLKKPNLQHSVKIRSIAQP